MGYLIPTKIEIRPIKETGRWGVFIEYHNGTRRLETTCFLSSAAKREASRIGKKYGLVPSLKSLEVSVL